MRNPKRKPFCWQCGKPLEARDGQLIFAVVRVGDQDVKVHKVCQQSAMDYQRFDSTPSRWPAQRM